MSRRDGEAPRPQAESDTSRLETFSDGVMAIAITLLILDVKVPRVQHGLWHALADQWPSYAAFVTSFLTIGIIWANHHRMFKLIARTTNAFLMINKGLHRLAAIRGHLDMVALPLQQPHCEKLVHVVIFRQQDPQATRELGAGARHDARRRISHRTR